MSIFGPKPPFFLLVLVWCSTNGQKKNIKMDGVTKILRRAGCLQYAPVFDELGYDSAGHLLSMGPTDLSQLQQECKIKAGHMHRLRNVLSQLNYEAHVINAPNEEEDSGPASAAESGAPTEVPLIPLVEAPAEASTTTVKKKQKQLLSKYATWPEAKLASYAFSTRAGHKAQVDRKKSGGNRKVVRCSSVLSKKRKAPEDDPVECPHVLVWQKKKKEGDAWVLNKEKSHMAHSPFCSAEQKATRMELLHDKKFVKHVKIETGCTGSSAAKQAIGGDSGRLDGCVSSVTARRAANDIMKYHDKDYDEDWSKLEGWKREYERKNPNSRCVFKDNPLSRGVRMYVLHKFGPMCLCFVIGPICVCLLSPVCIFYYLHMSKWAHVPICTYWAHVFAFVFNLYYLGPIAGLCEFS